jgi:hypothetical protein
VVSLAFLFLRPQTVKLLNSPSGKFLYGLHLQFDLTTLCCCLVLAICYLIMNISIAHCEFLATTFRVVLDLCLSQALQSPEVQSFISSIPLDIRRVLDILNLHPHTQSFICCLECYKLYPDSQDCPDLCTFRPTTDSETCNAPLYTRKVVRGAEKRYPTRKFLYHDMKTWLANMLSRPDIETYADRDVFLNPYDTPEELRDIWDGRVLKEFKGLDGKPFVQPGSREG